MAATVVRPQARPDSVASARHTVHPANGLRAPSVIAGSPPHSRFPNPEALSTGRNRRALWSRPCGGVVALRPTRTFPLTVLDSAVSLRQPPGALLRTAVAHRCLRCIDQEVRDDADEVCSVQRPAWRCPHTPRASRPSLRCEATPMSLRCPIWATCWPGFPAGSTARSSSTWPKRRSSTPRRCESWPQRGGFWAITAGS
jgi:hypothetical protein